MSTDDTDRRAKRLTRCAEPGCTETPTGGTHRSGKPACRCHATTESLLPIRPDPLPKATAGMISPRAIVGLDESGKRSPGGESWEYHEHYATPSEHHDEPFVIDLGEGPVLRFRQSPTVYSRLAPMLSPKAAATVAREVSEAEAERRYFGEIREAVGQRARNMSNVEVAEAIGISPARITRRGGGHSKGRKL